MNNRGQSLILFVLFVPLLLLLLYMVYQIGMMVKLKDEVDNINYLTMYYMIDKIDDEGINSLVNKMVIKNKNDIDKIETMVVDNKLYITIEASISNNILKKMGIFKIKSEYVGFIQNGKKVIERADSSE